ncbi:MAG: hypothetical protein DWQ36_15950 [Acidobacteria bacterium]|nr:MAG: hypothetical protein DWQ30_14625 [Acidobacteriota bacterium]REK05604.1 MAG: hypothetical protein DWQ36_15950 [Acidobacteriota bacterium]
MSAAQRSQPQTGTETPRRRGPSAWYHLPISALIGVVLMALLGLIDPDTMHPLSLVIGAMVGACIGGGASLAERLLLRVARPRRKSTNQLTRVLGYGIGGALGYLVSGLLIGWLFGLELWNVGDSLVLATASFGIFAVLVGLVFHAFEVLRGRLEDSVAQLKEAEFAARELETARGIQRRLLPPPASERPGYLLRAINRPARVVAGDLYDYFELADGRLAFAVGDVSGKGLGASLIMATVKARLPLVFAEGSLEETARHLNRLLYQELDRREFVALLLARLDPTSGVVEWVNCGLPDPILIGAAGGHQRELTSGGDRRPLGLASSVDVHQARLELRPGESLLLYTDGLPESLDERGEPRGYDWFARQVEATKGSADPAASLLDRVLAAEDGGAGGPEDDCTVLRVEWRPLQSGAAVAAAASGSGDGR